MIVFIALALLLVLATRPIEETQETILEDVCMTQPNHKTVLGSGTNSVILVKIGN